MVFRRVVLDQPVDCDVLELMTLADKPLRLNRTNRYRQDHTPSWTPAGWDFENVYDDDCYSWAVISPEDAYRASHWTVVRYLCGGHDRHRDRHRALQLSKRDRQMALAMYDPCADACGSDLFVRNC